jgi:hypothetical protein
MPTPYPHPFQCAYHPLFETKNEAVEFIEDYQANGHMKKCMYLTIRPFGDGFSADSFGPDCEQHSFRREDRGRGSSWFGCPVDCRMYRPAWWGKPTRWLKKQWWPFREFVVGTAQWFASLPMLTQVILLLIVLTVVGIPWRGIVWQIIKLFASTK